MKSTAEDRLNKASSKRTMFICISAFISSWVYISWSSGDAFDYGPVCALIIMLVTVGVWLFSLGSSLTRRNASALFFILGCGFGTAFLGVLFAKNSDHLRFWLMRPFYVYQVRHTPPDADGHKRMEWPWTRHFDFEESLIYDSRNPKHFDRQKEVEYSVQDGCTVESEHLSNAFYVDIVTCGIVR